MKDRLESLDALRGFTMVWIIGGDLLVHLLAAASGWAVFEQASRQLRHVTWEGLHAYDLVFPVFMYVSGVSLALSWHKRRERGVEGGVFLHKVMKRSAVLVGLGIIYNFGWDWSADRFRVASVLGQIGIAYLISGAICVRWAKIRAPVAAIGIILGVVAWLQLWFEVPGIGAGQVTPEGIVNGWIDRNVLPGKLYGGSYDPEGLLSVLSSSTVTLLGLVTGKLLLRQRFASGWMLFPTLVAVGVTFVSIGYALSPNYPMVKAAWTVPFDVAAAGYSMLVFAVFYLLVDLLNSGSLSTVLAPIGMNAIGVYLGARFLVYPVLNHLGPGNALDNPVFAIPAVVLIIAVEWLLLWWCYRRRWFFSV